MKRLIQTALLLLVALGACIAILNSVTGRAARTDRERAVAELREELDLPAEPPATPTGLSDAFPKPPEEPDDIHQRWERLGAELSEVFLVSDETAAERFRVSLCLSFEYAVAWTPDREAAVLAFLDEQGEHLEELLTLIKLRPPGLQQLHDPDTGHHIILAEHDATRSCLALLNVAAAAHALSGDPERAAAEILAALKLGISTNSMGDLGISLAEMDVGIDEALREGGFSQDRLEDLASKLDWVVDQKRFEDEMRAEAAGLLLQLDMPLHRQYWRRSDKVFAYVKRGLLPQVHAKGEAAAVRHAAELTRLAALPYHEIRGDLARLEKETQPHWYDPSVKSRGYLSVDRDFVYRARMQARRDMATIALSLTGDGQYPSDAQDARMAAHTVDVFSGKPYHYQRLDQGFMLYSVGKDGADNNGAGDDVVLRYEGG